ncbi:response regulator [Paracoccus alcaliphilus]|nr:response regulator [Paracoccus alcaliphilus]
MAALNRVFTRPGLCCGTRTGIGGDLGGTERKGGDQAALMRRIMLACASQLQAGQVPALDLAGLGAENAAAAGALAAAVAHSTHKSRSLSAGLETLSDGFAVFDHRMRLLYANRAFRNFFAPALKLTPGTHVDQVVDALSGGDLIQITEGTRATLLKQLADGDGLPRNVTARNGQTYRWFLKYDDSRHLICLASDITAETRREQELEQARLQAEQGIRTRSRFLTHMSHELRTPLNGVIGMAEVLAETGQSPEQLRLIRTIRSSAEALLSIINDMLDLARREHARPARIEAPFNLEAMAIEVLTLLCPNAVEKKLDLRLSYDTLTPASHVGDPGRVRQVLFNLLGNAVKYTVAGHVRLRIQQCPGGVIIMVEDSGPGIADEDIDGIFDEFTRLPDPTGRETPAAGTGLGLAITSRLVAEMGGKLWLCSSPGQGSTFGARLPLPAVPDSMARPAVQPGKASDTPWIMFICSRRLVWRRARHILATADLRMEGCADLDGAKAMLDAGRMPALIIYDDNRDIGRALALRRELARIAPGIPVWIMAAVVVTLPPGHGFDRIVTTPVERAALTTAARQVLYPPDAGPQRRMRVLAVDDNATNRLVIDRMLAGCNIGLRMATNGAQAVGIWRDWHPDLILMDVLMPVLDGPSAARQIRGSEGSSLAARTRIVAITANAAPEERGSLLAAGMDDIAAKPIRREQLFRLLSRYRPPGTLPPLPGSADKGG